eukprot:6185390-Pleurochrysis_carterae.AAC.2
MKRAFSPLQRERRRTVVLGACAKSISFLACELHILAAGLLSLRPRDYTRPRLWLWHAKATLLLTRSRDGNWCLQHVREASCLARDRELEGETQPVTRQIRTVRRRGGVRRDQPGRAADEGQEKNKSSRELKEGLSEGAKGADCNVSNGKGNGLARG